MTNWLQDDYRIDVGGGYHDLIGLMLPVALDLVQALMIERAGNRVSTDPIGKLMGRLVEYEQRRATLHGYRTFDEVDGPQTGELPAAPTAKTLLEGAGHHEGLKSIVPLRGVVWVIFVLSARWDSEFGAVA